MARSGTSIEQIILAAVQRVTDRIVPAIQQALAAAAAARGPARRKVPARRPARPRRRRSPEELTRWVADRRARRVPTFVIEMTGGLDTKKRIVAKYGENVAFEKGKAPPAPRLQPEKPARALAERETAARVVKAKPPIVRKAAAR